MFAVVDSLTIVHAVHDARSVANWYQQVLFGQEVFYRDHSGAQGTAARLQVADVTVEPISSGSAASNIHRVCQRYGERLYSTAWLVDDLTTCFEELRSSRVRAYSVDGKPVKVAPANEAIFTHSRDTGGTLEFALLSRHTRRGALLVQGNGLLSRCVSLISLVKDLDVALPLYERLFRPRSIRRSTTSDGSRIAVLSLVCGLDFGLRAPGGAGDELVELLRRRGEGAWGMRFEVEDSAKIEAHLAHHGIECVRRSEVLVAADSSCHGVGLEFVERRSAQPSARA